jgi:hypothetical protein
LDANVICGDKLFFVANARLFYFGILTSHMHNAWMRTVCGRLKSDYSYSNTIVYNNFPFPAIARESKRMSVYSKIETAAQAILDARQAEQDRCTAQGQKYSLATLYAAGNMPADLRKAHTALDKAVDAAYAYKTVINKDGATNDDAARVAFLFLLYQTHTAPLIDTAPLKKKTAKK